MESNWTERTIAVSGFPEDILPSTVIADKLTIHFLRPRNGGGEVESIMYPVDVPGIAYVTFEKEEVMDSVLRKEHVLEDKQLPSKYPLKVSPNNVEVFNLVSVDLDVSIFGEMSRLAQELEDNYKSLCFSRCPGGRLHIEGSFSAMKGLRKDLQRRLDELQEFPLPSSKFKSGASASGGRCARHPSDNATRRTESQRLAASTGHGASDATHSAVFEEETTIILDADIFEYIDKCWKDHYEQLLCKHCVRAQVRNCDGISILQLEKVCDQCSPFQLRAAKLEIESLINQMQQLLVSERIRLDGGKGQSKIADIYREIEQRLPFILIRITDEYVTLIGSSEHCSQFKKEVKKKVKTVESMFDSTSSGSSHIPNATGYSNHSGQSLSSNTAREFDVPSKSEYSPNPNSHSGQYTKSQANSSLMVSSRDESNGKWTSCGAVGPLGTGPSSLPVQLQMSTTTVESKFCSTSGVHSHILSTIGSPINFGQCSGSNAALAEYAHSKSEYGPNPNSHSGQCTKSWANSLLTVSNRDDSYGKWTNCGAVGPLGTGPSSLPVQFQMGMSTMESKLGSMSTAHAYILNTTGSPINFGQHSGSNAALAECAHNKSVYGPNPNSHSGQCTKSQAFPTVPSRKDSFGM